LDIIRLLPDSVANQIAAGEVIQRPASVIKELVENAIDAGAGNIDIYVLDAGRTLIQVIDDGKGMSETDARLAFERHATSKITKAEDLFTLRTMGFRGEALPSIAAVSQLVLQTRTHDSELGTKLEIEGGRVLSQEPCVCPLGSNFEVRNLFFNIPARRKFLKSNHTELSNILQEIERIALVNHSVSFSYTIDGTATLRLVSSNLRRRIVDIFGKKTGDDLIAVDVDTTLVRIEGFVGRPDSSRKKGAHQFFYVNGRYMRHPYFAKAVASAFDGLVPEGEQVPYFLYLDIDPANIDVNISPTKTEVKFENEPAIWQIIHAGIREALGRFNAVPTIDFDNAHEVDIPVMNEELKSVQPPQVKVDSNYNPFLAQEASQESKTRGSFTEKLSAQKLSREWGMLYEHLSSKSQGDVTQQPMLFEQELESVDEVANVQFQYRGQYIVSATNSGLMIIDQRRAHIRVLYDKYMDQMQQQQAITQGLLFPELVSFPASDSQLFEQLLNDIRSIGFDIESLGGGSYSVNGMPAGFEGLSPQKLLQELIVTVTEGGDANLNTYRHNIALSFAKSSAIVEGLVLNRAEIETLMSDLFKSSNPNVTPDGRNIIIILKHESIEKMFL
jgi:DNA mismatch repair protein MutL